MPFVLPFSVLKLQLRVLLRLTALAVIFISVPHTKVWSQHCPFYTIDYKDSIIVSKEKNVVYNNIILVNPRNKRIVLNLRIDIPEYWKVLNGNQFVGKTTSLDFAAHDTVIIPLSLLKTPQIKADWERIKITITMLGIDDVHSHYSYIRVSPAPRFVVRKESEDIFIRNNEEPNFVFKVYIKNSGNISDNYRLHWHNYNLNVLDTSNVFLQPGQDTVIVYKPVVRKNRVKYLYNEEISAKITSGYGDSKVLNYTVAKEASTHKINQTNYDGLPVAVEAGYMRLGERYSLYGGLSGKVVFGDHNLSFSYKSKQYGTYSTSILPNVFSLDYRYKKFRMTIGQINSSDEFITMGTGVSLNYKDKNREVGIKAVKHYNIPSLSYLSNDNISAFVKNNWRQFSLTNRALFNRQTLYKVNSYIFDNELQYTFEKRIKIVADGGIGLDQYNRYKIGMGEALGYRLGYQFEYSPGPITLNSRIKLYSDNYPGIYKGFKSQMHELRLNSKKSYGGIFYQSDFYRQNILRDSIFISDYLSSNTTRMGVTLGYLEERNSVNLRIGKLSQSGLLNLYNLDNAGFLDFYLSLRRKNALSISLTSLNAYKNEKQEQPVFVTNTSVNISSPYGGVYGSFSRIPIFRDVVSSTNLYRETFNGGPFVSFRLFRQKLSTTLRYNFSKSFQEDFMVNGIGGDIRFSDDKSGTNISLSGFFPFRQRTVSGLPPDNMKYFCLTFRKSLALPVFSKNKYGSLKVILFEDINGNKLKDPGEPFIKKAHLSVEHGGTYVLTTDEQGTVFLKNVPFGTYTINCLDVKSELITEHGPVQTVEVSGSTNYPIPFRKGKLLKGIINMIHDSLSNNRITPERIRVTVNDSSGVEYSTLTDERGQFLMYLPPGSYSVSINKQMFEGSGYTAVVYHENVNLLEDNEAFVNFKIIQKKRKVNMSDFSK